MKIKVLKINVISKGAIMQEWTIQRH